MQLDTIIDKIFLTLIKFVVQMIETTECMLIISWLLNKKTV